MATKKEIEEKIAKWKKAYGEVYKITASNRDDKGLEIIEGGKKEYVAYFKKAGRESLSFASKMSEGGADFVKFIESLVEVCWLEGDNEIKENDSLMMSAGRQLNETVPAAKSQLEKL